MRKPFFQMFLVSLLFIVTLPQPALAIVHPAAPAPTTEKESARAQELLRRLDDLKAIDKSELTRSEKKALRQEVRSIKKELRQISGGVYLSTAAIIIIVLLLILLL